MSSSLARAAVELMAPAGRTQGRRACRWRSRTTRCACSPNAAGAGHVLQNLLSNAIKYGPPDGEVVLSVTRRGGMAALAVHDRGPGIAAQDRERLFRRFVRLGATPTGGETSTGLGLALAKQRARAMGGDLWYEDRPGGGASFVFELPLA